MENACYYTFSTVCQMLAGAFGFLLAAVLFRVQSLEIVIRAWKPDVLSGSKDQR